MAENRKETVGAIFNLSPSVPSLLRNPNDCNTNSLPSAPPPPPPMTACPSVQKMSDSSRAPPPLKRMSTNLNNKDTNSSISAGEDVEPASLFGQSTKKSTLDSLLGKIIANKNPENENSDLGRSSVNSAVAPSVSNSNSMATPPPLRRCAPSPDPTKNNRRKQQVPQATNDRITESPPREVAMDVAVPDIDDMLKSCAVVTPVEAPNLQIDIMNSDDDEDWAPMRVSSKGRVVKKPSWTDAYTSDLAATETEEEWTPERPSRSSDAFKPRAPPPISLSALGKGSITHEDLHPSMIMESPPAALLLPFHRGWVRELVIRNPQNEDLSNMERKHTNADAYYYAPKEYKSVKLRSVVKIQEFLREMKVPDLTGDNFSFAKRAFYKPPEEFVRLAGKTSGRKFGRPPESKKVKAKPNKVKTELLSPPSMSAILSGSTNHDSKSNLPTTPVNPSSPVNISEIMHPTRFGNQRRSSSNGPTMRTPPVTKKRTATTPSSQPMKKIKADKSAVERAKQYLTNSFNSSNLNILPKSPAFKVVGPAGKPPSLKPPQPCTSDCRGVRNTTPSVQCGVCLLLYHPECINWSTHGRDALFVCSICIMKSRKEPGMPKSNGVSGQTGKVVIPALPKDKASNKDSGKLGRLITIPLHVLDRIDTTSPFALKLNNETFKIDPSQMMKTDKGVQIYIKDDKVVMPTEFQKAGEIPKPSSVATSAPKLNLVVPKRKYNSLLDCYRQISAHLPSAELKKPVSSVTTSTDGSRRDVQVKKEPVASDTSEPMESNSQTKSSQPDISSNIVTDSETSDKKLKTERTIDKIFSVLSSSGGGTESSDKQSTDSHNENSQSQENRSSQSEKDASPLTPLNKELDERENDVETKELSSGEVAVQWVVKCVADAVDLFQKDVKRYRSAIAAYDRQVNRAENNRPPPPLTAESTTLSPQEFKATKQSSTSVGSLSKILYEQSPKTSVKAYGKEVSPASAHLLRSLVPKSQQVTRPTGKTNIIVIPSGEGPTTSTTSRLGSTSSMPMGSVVLSSGMAPIGNGTQVVSHSSTPLHSKALPVYIPTVVSRLDKKALFTPPMSKIMVLNSSSPAIVQPSSIRPFTQMSPMQTIVKPHFQMVAEPTPKQLPSVSVKRNVECQTDTVPVTPAKVPSPPIVCRPITFSLTGEVFGCLSGVFRYLSVQDRLRAGAVCKLWRAVSRDPSLNEDVFYNSGSVLTSKAVKELVRALRIHTVKHLALLYSRPGNPRFQNLGRLHQQPLLRFLSIYSELLIHYNKVPKMDTSPPESLLQAISELSSLVTLSIDSIAADDTNTSWLTSQHLASILSMPILTSLSLSGGLDPTVDLSTLSLSTCAPLVHLSLRQFSAVHAMKIIEVISRSQADTIRTLSLEISASLQNGMLNDDERTVDNELSNVLRKCTKVKNLRLCYSRLDIDTCEAEYLKDTLSTTFPNTDISVSLYD